MTSAEAPEIRESSRRRAVIAAGIGTVVEWYDYAIYGYLAATLGVVFFPSEDPTTSLLASFATFGLAFLIRPAGALFFGSMGDRLGRKATLTLVVVLISTGTFLIGVLPGYGTLGVAAPVLLVILRMVQGLSAGGEVGGAMSLLAEYAPENRRCFMVSLVNIAAFLGAIVGGAVVTLLTLNLSPDAMTSWGWRIPFLIAGPLGMIGLYLRLKLEETPDFVALVQAKKATSSPIRETVTRFPGTVAICGGLELAYIVVYYFTLAYIPGYLAVNLGFDQTGVFLSTILAFVSAIITTLIMARISDRIGRKPVMITGCIVLAIIAVPAFQLLQLGLPGVLAVNIVFGIVIGTLATAPFASMVEIFPTRVRYTGFALGTNLVTAAFGGSAPFIATYLVSLTGNDGAPAFYVIAAAIGSLVAMFIVRETANRPLRQT